jgi:dihydroorotate dehydrogenase electron transfer subunit
MTIQDYSRPESELREERGERRHLARVIESQAQGSFHRLRLSGGAIASGARPGQFVHILPRSAGGGQDPLLRRAFSIMSVAKGAAPRPEEQLLALTEGASFEVLFRVGGRGTSTLARCRLGDELEVLGPLGNGFDLGAPASQAPLFLVGGGIGVPPLIFAARAVSHETKRPGDDSGALPVEAFVGARTASEIVGEEILSTVARVHLATEDGSRGRRGLVTAVLRERLLAAADSGARPAVCACGPWPMLRAVALLCAEFSVPCQVSLEENMPCGIGVCNGCVVPVLNAADDYGRFQRICVQGPVLDARVVDWGDASLHAQGPSLPAAVDDSPLSPTHQGASQ